MRQIQGSFLTMTNAFTIAGCPGPIWNISAMNGVTNWWWMEARTTEYWFGSPGSNTKLSGSGLLAGLRLECGEHLGAVIALARRRLVDLAGLQVTRGLVDHVIERIRLVLVEHELDQAHDEHEEDGREQRELDHHVAGALSPETLMRLHMGCPHLHWQDAT
jgi:hypothetical protein